LNANVLRDGPPLSFVLLRGLPKGQERANREPKHLVKLHTILLGTCPIAFLHTALRTCGNVAFVTTFVTTLQTYPAPPFAVPGSFGVCQLASIPYENARENHSAGNTHTRGSSTQVVGLWLRQAKLARFASRYPRQRGSCCDRRFADSPNYHSLPALIVQRLFKAGFSSANRATLKPTELAFAGDV